MNFNRSTRAAARGRWRGILLELGMEEKTLSGHHGLCPMCGGKDRFRFDNKEGRGTRYCNLCGAGDGMHLAEKYTGKPFPVVASVIDRLLGSVRQDQAQRSSYSDGDRQRVMSEVLRACKPITTGDLADRYFTSRGLGDSHYSEALRFARGLRDGEGGIRPCLVADVADHAGKRATLHRTFLRADGLAKAEMNSPRKLLPGKLPGGSSIRLSAFSGGALGIAEGIETGLAASKLFQIPVWSAIYAGNLDKWIPPTHCTEVVIMADNDRSGTGQAAAFRLKARLYHSHPSLQVSVQVPPAEGQDWADVWLLEGGAE